MFLCFLSSYLLCFLFKLGFFKRNSNCSLQFIVCVFFNVWIYGSLLLSWSIPRLHLPWPYREPSWITCWSTPRCCNELVQPRRLAAVDLVVVGELRLWRSRTSFATREGSSWSCVPLAASNFAGPYCILAALELEKGWIKTHDLRKIWQRCMATKSATG